MLTKEAKRVKLSILAKLLQAGPHCEVARVGAEDLSRVRIRVSDLDCIY